MADLIAQGSQPQFRWRRHLPLGSPQVLGRGGGPWSTPWDERISRKHAELIWQEGRLQIRLLPDARNPIFYRGRRQDQFEIQPGDHFVIGETTFTLANERVALGRNEPNPITERTFSIEELHSRPYRRPDQRMEVLGRLPDVITSSANDTELFTRLINLLLGGITRAAAAAIVEITAEQADDKCELKVLHWDRRILSGADFNPSERLIRQAVKTKQSVAYVWSGAERGPGDFTLSEGLDWAFCTPISGNACKGWALYVTGSFAGDAALDVGADVESLGEEIKFTELTAATFGSLREARFLARKQAGLSQFFSPVVLEALADQDADIVLQPREADVTVLFCDLRGFSRTSEKLATQLHELLQRVSQALGVTTHHILQTGGVVGDFHGDAVMGFWGWPLPQADAVKRACHAALGIRAEFAAAAAQVSAEGAAHPLANFRMGIGIATGRAVAGKIGTIDQVKVTVFGPVVNLASRLEGMTKDLRVPILLDEVTAAEARKQLPTDEARVRQLAKVRPQGLDTPVVVSELLPPFLDWPQLTDEHIAAFESAGQALANREWSRALQLLHQVPPDDLAKDFLTVFIAQHNRTPPENWDGVVPVGRG